MLVLMGLLGPCGSGAWAGPPPVPKAFTREIVEELIAKVDEGRNAMLLKVPYLVSRRKHPFPHHLGLKMMREAVKAEEPSTKRWILLKCLYAFGTYQRGAFLDTTTYIELFENQLARPNPEASREINSALFDFLHEYSACPYPETVRSAKTAKAMGLAARLYLAWPELRYRELDFGPVLEKAKDIQIVKDALDRAAQSALAGESGSTYVALKRAGMIYKPWKPEEALALFQKAEPLLNREDRDEVERFYTHEVDVLVSLKRVDEAIAAQKKLQDLTGRGQVRLLVLREQAGQKDAIDRGLGTMDYATIGEKELRDLCERLFQAKESVKAVPALRGYLQASRQRDPGCELWARYRLASLLATDKKFDEARKVADASHLKPPFSTAKARIYYGRLEKLRRRLSAKAGKQ